MSTGNYSITLRLVKIFLIIKGNKRIKEDIQENNHKVYVHGGILSI